MKAKTILCITLFAAFFGSMNAQERDRRFGFEFSPGASFALNKLDDASLNPGFGFEASLHYRILPHTGAYVGWGWNRLNADKSFVGNDICFEETGYVFGLQFRHPISNSPLFWYFRAGGLYNHIEVENPDGDIIMDTGHGLGAQLATGLDLPLGSNWCLTPGLKFNTLGRELKDEGITRELKLNYVQLRIGIKKNF